MKRFGYFAVLMALGSPAQAGSSLSFVVGGHRISIEAPRNCRSTSCVSVTIPGIHETRRGRDRDDDMDNAAAAKPLDPAPVSLPVVPPANRVSIAPVVPEPPRQAVVGLAAATTQELAPPPLPKIQVVERPPMQPPAIPSVTPPPIRQPADTVRPAPQVSGFSNDKDDEAADLPLGDWQAGRGSVRIEKCGRALCGYVLDPSSNAGGEMLLINMKPKTDSEWTGNIFSRDSGNTYYATMAIKGPDSLRVEACALGNFFCSGNLWNRIGARPEKLISSRRISPPPRS